MTGGLVVVNKLDEAVAIDARSVVPAVIRHAGPRAEEKFFEFFAASIRNMNTRMAYLRAAKKFFAWVEARNLRLDHCGPSMSPPTSSNTARQ